MKTNAIDPHANMPGWWTEPPYNSYYWTPMSYVPLVALKASPKKILWLSYVVYPKPEKMLNYVMLPFPSLFKAPPYANS